MVTLKTTFSDGDVFSSGTTASDDALNGITNEVNRKGVIHRKVYSSAAEETQSGASAIYTYLDTNKTFNLVAPVNSLIIGINILFSLKSNESNQSAYSILKISGTNFGTKYISSLNSADGVFITSNTFNKSATLVSTNNGEALAQKYGDSYYVFSTHFNKPIKILDTTTTFMFQLCSSAAHGTTRALFKDVVVEVVYVENFIEDA